MSGTKYRIMPGRDMSAGITSVIGVEGIISDWDSEHPSLINGRRFSNKTEIGAYMAMAAGTEGWYEAVETLTSSAKMEEFMFLGLRMVRGVSEKDFYRKFGVKIMSVYGEAVRKNEAEGLLLRKNGRLRLTELGMDLANRVMADFIL